MQILLLLLLLIIMFMLNEFCGDIVQEEELLLLQHLLQYTRVEIKARRCLALDQPSKVRTCRGDVGWNVSKGNAIRSEIVDGHSSVVLYLDRDPLVELRELRWLEVELLRQ